MSRFVAEQDECSDIVAQLTGSRTAYFFERYNENHDPDNGQFSDGGGSGGGSSGSSSSGGTTKSATTEASAAQKHAAEPIASNLFDKYHDSSATADDIVHSVAGASAAIGEAERKLKDATPANAPIDKGGFIGADGNYTPEREELHQRILDELFTPETVRAATPAA